MNERRSETTTMERRIAMRAARAMEQAVRYLRSGRPQDAIRVLMLEARAARDDLKECQRAA
jgi:hypothetical protein